MPKEGSNAFYRAFADRWYLDRANRDTYLKRDSAGNIGISGNLGVPALSTVDGVDLSVHAVDYGLHTRVITKVADETINNSNTFQNDDELLLAMAANEVWYGELVLYVIGKAAEDIKTTLSVPSGCTGRSRAFGFPASAEELTASISTALTDDILTIALSRYFVINGSTAGNLQLQWAQATKGATDLTVKANSFLRLTKLA